MRDAGPWIDAALASLFRQTVHDFEIVAVDDGSSDDSPVRLAAAAGRDPRLRVVTTAARGLPAALETARAAATGAFLARHDADDLSHRRRLEIQLDHLARHAEVDVVGTRLRLVPSANAQQGMLRWARWHNSLLTHEAMARDILVDSPLAHGSALFRRGALDAVGGWQERGWAEDLDLWVRMLDQGLRLGKCPERLYAWRQHPGSATRADTRYAAGRFRALKLEALARGVLRGRAGATLVGVGTSVRSWADSLAGIGVRAEIVERARPARERWRAALVAAGSSEGRDFVFVA